MNAAHTVNPITTIERHPLFRGLEGLTITEEVVRGLYPSFRVPNHA